MMMSLKAKFSQIENKNQENEYQALATKTPRTDYDQQDIKEIEFTEKSQ